MGLCGDCTAASGNEDDLTGEDVTICGAITGFCSSAGDDDFCRGCCCAIAVGVESNFALFGCTTVAVCAGGIAVRIASGSVSLTTSGFEFVVVRGISASIDVHGGSDAAAEGADDANAAVGR